LSHVNTRSAATGKGPGGGNCLSPGSITMLDLILLALGLGFFALSVGYAYACERL
jgi:hypothetical protein